MKLKMKLAVAALMATGLSAVAAYADTVTLTLTNPDGYASALTGGSVTYDATVSAPASNTAPVYLNGDSYNVTAPVILDDSDFFNNFPLSLAPGTSYTGDLFVLTLPAGSSIETYLGTFTLLGGTDGSATDPLDTVDFSLTATPEPSSIVLLLTGMAGLLFWAGAKGNLRGWAR